MLDKLEKLDVQHLYHYCRILITDTGMYNISTIKNDSKEFEKLINYLNNNNITYRFAIVSTNIH